MMPTYEQPEQVKRTIRAGKRLAPDSVTIPASSFVAEGVIIGEGATISENVSVLADSTVPDGETVTDLLYPPEVTTFVITPF